MKMIWMYDLSHLLDILGSCARLCKSIYVYSKMSMDLGMQLESVCLEGRTVPKWWNEMYTGCHAVMMDIQAYLLPCTVHLLQ